jgi:outer membrane protein assembly factor BamB
MRIVTLGLFAYWSFSIAGRAADLPKEQLKNWHQWRGPLATGMAPQGDPPLKWDSQTNVKWKATIPGKGSATPVIWEKRVFVLTAIDSGRAAKAGDLPKSDGRYFKRTRAPKTYYKFVVLCLDRQTGKILWERTATEQVPHEGIHPTHSYAAASPTTDGKYVYASFGSRGIYCYDMAGKFRWKRNLGLMQTRYGWGEGTSPVIHGDTLMVNWDHEGASFIIALDARTGETRWKVDRKEPSSWATPLVVEHRGKSQVIVNGKNRVRSYDLATGKVLWQCGGQTINAIPSPVAVDGVVFCMTGYRGSAAYAIPLDATGDITDKGKTLWSYSRGTPYVPSPVLAGDRLYFTQGNNPLLTCLNIKTGKAVIDRQRLPGLNTLYASPAGARDRLYLTDREGTTLVIRRADKLEILATNRLEEPVDASPAIAGKQLFLRGHEHLYCIEAK